MEFFKLDYIDRKVLLWLLDNSAPIDMVSWMEDTADSYRKKSIQIDVEKLYNELQKGLIFS